jgi:hypothetical protein
MSCAALGRAGSVAKIHSDVNNHPRVDNNMLLRLRIVTCSAINFHPLEQPTLPVGKHGLPFTVIFLIDTDLMVKQRVSIGVSVPEPDITHFEHNMLIPISNAADEYRTPA